MESSGDRDLRGLSEEDVASEDSWLQEVIIQPYEVYKEIYLQQHPDIHGRPCGQNVIDGITLVTHGITHANGGSTRLPTLLVEV